MIMGRCSWPIADVPPPHGIRDSERQRPVPLRLQAEYRAFAVESEFVDHVDPGSVPMIAEMAPLHRPRNDVGPKGGNAFAAGIAHRSEEHTSELQSLMRISYAVFRLKKNKLNNILQT